MTTRTLLLGAGFSKAFDPRMPLMSDLGPQVVTSLGLSDDTLVPFGGNVERWLSYLAERQPWDTEEQTLVNRSQFLRASDAVAQCVRDASSNRPDPASAEGRTMARFVLEAKMSQTPVLTFNYDLLIENALQVWDPWAVGSDIYPLPVVERHPAGMGRFLSANAAREPVLELFKLHGSLNWRAPADGSDAPVTLGPGDSADGRVADPRLRYLYSDLRTLIVPPTSTKSLFYGGSAIRALWRAAAERLRNTRELVVIGYSFPMSDHQVSTMLRTCLPSGGRITIVNRDPAVGERVRDEFPEHEVRLVEDALAYVDAACGWLLSWTYTAAETGQEEQLQVADAIFTRFVPVNDLALATNAASQALNQLAKHAPSISGTWRDAGRTADGYPLYEAYLPRKEWDNLHSALHRDGWVPGQEGTQGTA